MISFFPLWPSDLATFQQNCIYGLYISQLMRYSSIEDCGKNKGNYIPRVLDGKAKKSHDRESFSRLQDLSLRNIWVTNDMDILTVVVTITWSFHLSWLITGFVTLIKSNNTTDAISLFRTGYPSITYEFTLVFVCFLLLSNSCFPIFTCLCSVLWTIGYLVDSFGFAFAFFVFR